MKMTDVRADIPAKYKWDLTEIYADAAQFEADFSRAKAAIADYPKHEATIAKSAAGLYAALSDYIKIMLLVAAFTFTRTLIPTRTNQITNT